MARAIRQVMTPDPIIFDAEDTVLSAARAMKDHSIGDVIVLDGSTLCGVVTDRDLVVRVLAEGADPAGTPLRAVCSKQVRTLGPDDDVDEAVKIMAHHAVRRIPVVQDKTVVGVVSIGDLAIERDERSALAWVSAAPPNS